MTILEKFGRFKHKRNTKRFNLIRSDCLLSLLLASLVVGFIPSVTASQTYKSDSTALKRPKIGLVLSGGGARGFAHIGILKILEENHIPIDYIAGTSMGSLIGALYASGMTPDEMTKAFAKINWDGVFDDNGPRTDKTTRGKEDDRIYQVEQQIGVKDGSLHLPTAFIQGQRFELALRKLTLQASKISDFDNLPIPYRAVATDITTGEAVILGKGDLSVAVRASMAVPGVFAAVEIDGKLLVDGGMANNLPISVVRDMGADIIIAIDISTPLLKREEINDALDVMNQLTGMLTRGNIKQQITGLTQQDILIIPELGDLTSSDFKRYDDAITIGITAATKQLAQLKPLAISAADYTVLMSSHNTDYFQQPVIEFIRFNNDSLVDEAVLRARMEIKLGELLDTDAVDKGINAIYALGNYSHVKYSIVEEDDKVGLEITAREKEWGTSGVLFGLDLSTNFDGDNPFGLFAAYTHKPLNGLNGEWRTAIEIGANVGILTEWYQPLDNKERYFINPILIYANRSFNFYSGNDVFASYRVKSVAAELWVGRNFGDQSTRLRFGYTRDSSSGNVLTGDPSLQSFDVEGAQIRTEILYDSHNSLAFPTSGSSLELTYGVSRKDFGADYDYDEATIQALTTYPLGKGSLLFRAKFNTTLDNKGTIANSFSTGGFLALSGLQKNQLSGQHTGLLLAAYMHKLNTSLFFTSYVGASLELGNAWQNTSQISYDNSLTAGSLFVGADTPIGPIYLAFGAADNGENSIYLLIGSTPWF